MGRVLKIVMYLVLMFLVYLWFSTVFKSCNTPDVAGAIVETTSNTIDDIAETGEDFVEEADDFFDDEDDYEELDYEALDTDEDFEDEDVYEEEDYTAPAAVEKPKPAPRQTKPSSSNSSNAKGNYFVITGSYLVESNAKEMRDKLSKLGYDAEVVVFDGSQYHAVISGRYVKHSDASEVSRKLTGKGIDNFVQKQKL
jgi:hypothetical protein